MQKKFSEMPEHQWSEFLYEKQLTMMSGLKSQLDILDACFDRFGDQYTNTLLDERALVYTRLRDLHYSTMRLMDHLKPNRPLLSMDFRWTDDLGQENRLVITPGWREKTFNILTRLLRKWLLNGQMQLTD